jgi:hypothetical protein
MHRIGFSEKDDVSDMLEKRIWQTGGQRRVNYGLASPQFSQPKSVAAGPQARF